MFSGMSDSELRAYESKLQEAVNAEPREGRISVYSSGIIACSVCSPFDVDETRRRLNEEYPTGLNWGWCFSEDPEFKEGEPNPCPCEKSPETHTHYLFTC